MTKSAKIIPTETQKQTPPTLMRRVITWLTENFERYNNTENNIDKTYYNLTIKIRNFGELTANDLEFIKTLDSEKMLDLIKLYDKCLGTVNSIFRAETPNLNLALSQRVAVVENAPPPSAAVATLRDDTAEHRDSPISW
jgi:hypothetical protein